MMSASNIRFEMAERSRAVNYGGIGAIHLMGQKLGLAQEIDGRVQLFKRHLPYHESDHVLNPACWKRQSSSMMPISSKSYAAESIYQPLAHIEAQHECDHFAC
jgi:hypothetical protein